MSDRLMGVMSSLWSHFRDVGDLVPEVGQLDCPRFQASVSAAGVVTQPDEFRVPSQYGMELMGWGGYIESPGDAVANFPLLTWNAKEVGKRDVFGTSQSMAQVLTIFGPANPIVFSRSLYLFAPGAQVSLTFSRSGTWNGGAKVVGVYLICGLIAPDAVRR